MYPANGLGNYSRVGRSDSKMTYGIVGSLRRTACPIAVSPFHRMGGWPLQLESSGTRWSSGTTNPLNRIECEKTLAPLEIGRMAILKIASDSNEVTVVTSGD
jgi:hypothetical protein